MSVLVYKQRCHSPYENDIVARNIAHVGYIGSRPGVYKAVGANHGLFGNLDGVGIRDIERVNSAKLAIETASYQRRNVHRAILSMTRETSNELDLTDKDAWRDFVKAQIHIIAEGNGIKTENLRFVAAAHNEGGHPHVHIMFWDNAQNMNISFVPPKVPDNIRKKLIKSIFSERIREFCESKDIAVKSIRELSDDIIAQFENAIISISPKKFQKLLDMECDFDGLEDAVFAEELFRLREILPKKGRLTYANLEENARNALDRIVWRLITQNEAIRNAVSGYVDAKMDMTKLYVSNPEILETKLQTFTAEAEKLITAKILKAVKELNNIGYSKRHELYDSEQRQRIAGDLLMSILRSIDKGTRAANLDYDRAFGELSAQAKREKAIELRDYSQAR
jgi:predicted nucleic acid-binding OB-fold protein